jgi:3'-5' exonuclease
MTASKRRHWKRQLRNEQLSVKTPFRPLNDHVVYVVNRSTNTDLLHDLIHLAQVTRHFSIDTESDMYGHRPALIQIECIHPAMSTVILIEACHLPTNTHCLSFWLIRSLLRFVLQPTNTILSWSNIKQELAGFVHYRLFSLATVEQLHMIDVQVAFKRWYSRVRLSDPTGHQQWGLQAAIADLFDQFLDKTETMNVWSRGLAGVHRPAYRYNDAAKLEAMIRYAANDCLAVTKLAWLIGVV